ncbi:hypothetical protein [Natrialbaceae archaeon AArc-T1-2]|uniref:hypothetical protein n=1 Tax=Natrialbaceae archaeon AArc-T1-2 TaxID=3053904 RepID=UPI00255B15B2|nr:hypothetical protein [Natrialbaceae archaeon AArc-T1-2]WIV65689.1 hypothetical protein QQ977_08210 [Natrialbaceae archaeon AArc-T1-2]
MPLEHPPIPPETLPPGWGAAETDDEYLAYRHNQPPITLIAEQTELDRVHPGLGLGRCWELRCRHFVGELPVSESIGCVSTRRAALDGLLACMDRIHDSVDEPHDSIGVGTILESVSLEELVPNGTTRIR